MACQLINARLALCVEHLPSAAKRGNGAVEMNLNPDGVLVGGNDTCASAWHQQAVCMCQKVCCMCDQEDRSSSSFTVYTIPKLVKLACLSDHQSHRHVPLMVLATTLTHPVITLDKR